MMILIVLKIHGNGDSAMMGDGDDDGDSCVENDNIGEWQGWQIAADKATRWQDGRRVLGKCFGAGIIGDTDLQSKLFLLKSPFWAPEEKGAQIWDNILLFGYRK